MTTADLTIGQEAMIREEPWPERQSIGIEEKEAVNALLDASIANGTPIGYGGSEEDKFCQGFSAYMGGGFADGVNSGTNAIYVALRSLGIEPFSEVIVGAVTDPGGMMPVPLMNCIPVVADAAPGTYNVGPDQIEERVSPHTSAILVAHIAGEPCDMPGIMEVAEKYNLPVVEDISQAYGATIDGQLVGTFGHIAAGSTMFSKLLTTGGQGGVVYTRDEYLYRTVKRMADRGKPFNLPADSSNVVASLNFNMDELAACLGRVALAKLPSIVEERRRIVSEISEGLNTVMSVSAPPQELGMLPSYWFLRLRFDAAAAECSKHDLCRILANEGVPMVADYDHMPHTFRWCTERRVFGNSGYPWASPDYKGDPNSQWDCPNAKHAIRDHFVLLINEKWCGKEIDDLLKTIRKAERQYGRK